MLRISILLFGCKGSNKFPLPASWVMYREQYGEYALTQTRLWRVNSLHLIITIFFIQLLLGVRESCWDSRSQWNPYHARDIFCGWQDRMQGNTGSVFPLWYLLTPKNYHVKVSFKCMAFLVWHPLEFIDNSYTELFEFLTHNFPSIIFICGTVPIYIFIY